MCEKSTPAYVKITTTANARTAPVVSVNTQVGIIKRDCTLQVIGETTEYYKVQLYVSKKFCKPA